MTLGLRGFSVYDLMWIIQVGNLKGVGVEEAMDICCEITVVRMHCGCCATNDDRIIMQ